MFEALGSKIDLNISDFDFDFFRMPFRSSLRERNYKSSMCWKRI